MAAKRNLLLTFDYELFLGKRSGHVESCLLKPSHEILNILERFKLKALFFIDTTYLLRLQEVNSDLCSREFQLIAEQIKELLRKGHDIGLHIHPHWLDAKYDSGTNEWCLEDLHQYSFMSLNKEDRELLFDKCYTLLSKLCGDAYKIECYRAGGLCIQPFEAFIPSFEKYGIRYEFSVFKGFRSVAKYHSFDFTNAPLKDIYLFENDVLKEQKGGRYTQVSIRGLELSLFWRALNSFYYRLSQRANIDTVSWGKGLGVKQEMYSVMNKRLSLAESFSVELMNPIKRAVYMTLLSKRELLHFISHPKLVSPLNLRSFECFLKKATQSYAIESDYKKIAAMA